MKTIKKPVGAKVQKKAEPFLRWAGGKKKLLPQYEKFFPSPDEYERYIEPFVGGGAVFFYVQSFGPKRSIIADLNEDLVNAYKAIRDNTNKLLGELEKHKERHGRDYYYVVRDNYNSSKQNLVKRAADFIYLNKASFNGLHRVNSKGEFNVPFGHLKNPGVYERENFDLISDLLKQVSIRHSSYEEILRQAKPGDFIYLDPPYFPLEGEKNFTSYLKDAFLEAEHIKLAASFERLHKAGCKLMLSNSDSALIRGLYKDFKIIPIKAKRFINCIGDKRGDVKEILVINY